MAIRSKIRNSVVSGGLDTLEEGRAELSAMLTKELKDAAPVDTGALKRSIRRGRGKVLARFNEVQGVITDAKGKHKGWIDRATDRAFDTFNKRS